MGIKEKPVDSLTATLAKLQQMQRASSAHVRQKAMLEKMIRDHQNMEDILKTKLAFHEPGELSRLMDKFLERVSKA